MRLLFTYILVLIANIGLHAQNLNINGGIREMYGSHTYESVSLTGGARINVRDYSGSTGGSGTLELNAKTITIGQGSIIDASGVRSGGPGKGRNTPDQAWTAGPGGSYGGKGGDGYKVSASGSTYGNREGVTAQMGSSGGNSKWNGNTVYGGYGGGLVMLKCETLTMHGSIMVEGGNGSNSPNTANGGGGGGSGGGVVISCRHLQMTGMISADGGNGGTVTRYGGGGGGGRIKILSVNSSMSNAAITANGGSGHQSGGSGTIWINTFPSSPHLCNVPDNLENPPVFRFVSTDSDEDSKLMYRIEISTDDFRTIYATYDQTLNTDGWSLASYSSGDTASFQPNRTFPDGKYQWRAYATDGYVWSDSWKSDAPVPDTFDRFAYDSSPPEGKPTVPIDEGVWSTSTSLTFQWTQGTSRDDESGIGSYALHIGTQPGASDFFSENVGNTTEYTVPNAIDGFTYYASVAAVNGANLTGTFTPVSDGITIDVSAGAVTDISSNTHPDTSQWYANSTVQLTWIVPDDPNDITGFHFVIDRVDTTNVTDEDSLLYQNELSVKLADGPWFVHISSMDGLGNVGPVTAHYPVRIDTEPPIIRHNPPVQAIRNAPLTLSGQVNDELTASTLSICYRIPGSGNYTCDMYDADNIFSLEIPGNYITSDGVEYYLRAEDTAGNVSNFPETEPKSNPVLVDQVIIDNDAPGAPQKLAVQGQNPSAWQKENSFDISWVNPPDLTGIKRILYKLDQPPVSRFDTTGSAAAFSPVTLSITKEGGQTVYLWLMDYAENCDFNHSAQIVCRYDQSAPRIREIFKPETIEENTSFALSCSITDHVGVHSAVLSFRRCGDHDFQQLPMLLSDTTYSCVLPANRVTKNGLEYYFTLSDSLGNLGNYPTDFEEVSRGYFAPVSFLKYEMTLAFQKNQWKMYSFPAEYDEKNLSVIFSPFGEYDNTKWRVFVFKNKYVEYQSSDFGNLPPGEGFWLRTTQENVKLDLGSGHSAKVVQGMYTITLAPGWNDIGAPFSFPIAWDAILAVNDQADELAGPYTFDGDEWQYPGNIEQLEPWSGYAIKNMGSSPRQLNIPAFAITEMPKKNKPEYPAWLCQLTAQSIGARDIHNYFGIAGDASDEFDRRDYPEPPANPGKFLSLYFPHRDWNEKADIYTSDFRSALCADSLFKTWQFAIRGNVLNEPIEVSIRNLTGDLENATIVNIETGICYDIEDGQKIITHLTHKNEIKRFLVLAGSKQAVYEQSKHYKSAPDHFSVVGNMPNPFNNQTRIRYHIPESMRLNVTIYNNNGQRVRTLVNNYVDAGKYILDWNGKNSFGITVPSGVYYCRFLAGNKVETVKMTLLK